MGAIGRTHSLNNYKIVDTHAHLCDSIFDPDRAEVIARARDAGVSAIFTVGENLSDAKLNIELAEKYPELMPAAGLYPSYLDINQAETLTAFIRREKNNLIAIGEVGLDFWIVKEEPAKDIQRKIFSDFIELSIELGLPLNVHSRSAGRHAVAMLLEQGAQKVQLHAFDGKVSAAMPAVEAGYFFSMPPSIVRSRQKQKLVKHLPIACLLVESDSPVLGPFPQQRNEPSNAALSVDAIAEIKDIRREEVIETVFENTCRLYGKFNLE